MQIYLHHPSVPAGYLIVNLRTKIITIIIMGNGKKLNAFMVKIIGCCIKKGMSYAVKGSVGKSVLYAMEKICVIIFNEKMNHMGGRKMGLLDGLSRILGRRFCVRVIASIIAAGIVMTGGLVYVTVTSISGGMKDRKTTKEIKEHFQEQYGIEVDVESYYRLHDSTDLFEFCEDYLYAIDGDNKTEKYMVYPTEDVSYHIMCSWEKGGEIKDTYQYHRMYDIAVECGLAGYISFDDYYNEEGYFDKLYPAFNGREIFNHKKKFYNMFEKYVEAIKKEDFLWKYNDCIYAIFEMKDEGGIYEFKIDRNADSKTEEKQYKQIKKWINQTNK